MAAGTSTSPTARPARRGLATRLSRCTDLDALVATTVQGVADLLGFGHSLLLLLDEDGRRLYTIASHGYPDEGVGSRSTVGDGIIGMAADARRTDPGRQRAPDGEVRHERAARVRERVAA